MKNLHNIQASNIPDAILAVLWAHQNSFVNSLEDIYVKYINDTVSIRYSDESYHRCNQSRLYLNRWLAENKPSHKLPNRIILE